MMKQYEEAKRACPDALLLFRMGDFYEMFQDDAKTAARVLNLALTSRDKGENGTPMAGFPHHQLESYLGKLIAAGFRAAVCEQVEDPKLAKGLVKREVTRVVTPGTITDDALLDPRESNYLAAVAPGDPFGLAWVEISTGRFVAAHFPAAQLPDQLARIAPAECLLAEDSPPLPRHLHEKMLVTRRPGWAFSLETARQNLLKHFHANNLEGFGFSNNPGDDQALRAAGAVIDYLNETQKTSLEHVDHLQSYRSSTALEIDESSRRSLEITRTIREGRREGSLLAVLDRTVTAMGSRLLADWLANPLIDVPPIQARQEAIAELVADSALADHLRETLRKVYDVQRLLARVTTGRASPRDLSFLGRTLRSLPGLKARLSARRSTLLNQLEAEIDLCPDLRSRLDAGLADDCPLSSRDGGFIRDGYHEPLDALRELAHGGKQWIARYQAEESQRTGISTLKVGFNKVFGYYIEITNTHREKIPAEYIRKQTVKNAERYITPELKEYEEKVLTADEKSMELEYELFLELRDAVAAARRRIAGYGRRAGPARRARLPRRPRPAAELLPAGSRRAAGTEDHRWPAPRSGRDRAGGNVRPQRRRDRSRRRHDPPDHRSQHGGQEHLHPPGGADHVAGSDRQFRACPRGPHRRCRPHLRPRRRQRRAGPGPEHLHGRDDRNRADLEHGHAAEPRDSRRDWPRHEHLRRHFAGLGVVEFLHEHVGCRTLFATHYHELTDLEKSLTGVKNLNVAVREWQEEVIFLHKIIPGAADKSYGIHVARLAGVPLEVVQRAKEILAQLEEEHLDAEGRAKIARPRPAEKKTHIQLTLFGPADHPLIDELRRVDLNNVTPLAAMQLLERWQDDLANEPRQR